MEPFLVVDSGLKRLASSISGLSYAWVTLGNLVNKYQYYKKRDKNPCSHPQSYS